MKLIAIEEHYVTDAMLRSWDRLEPRYQDDSNRMFPIDGEVARRLGDFSDERVRLMDESGVDVQVLSLTTPGTQNLDVGQASDAAHQANDIVAEAVRVRPHRFQGFATLPTPEPEAAARELERAVTQLGLQGAMMFGRTREHQADHPSQMPIYEAAASLRVPIYLHPQTPISSVRETYYAGLGDRLDLVFATGAIGWHYETGIQLLRLILSGVFDRYPDLQVIVGHWGEVVLFYLDRIAIVIEGAPHLRRTIADYVRQNIYVTPSGIFSQRYLHWAVDVLGVDRILFSTDYPYQYLPGGGARAFLNNAGLSAQDTAKIAHGNWERLCCRSGGRT